MKKSNDKSVSAVRKDEQKRSEDDGNVEATQQFRKSRYILMSKRSTLQHKDHEVPRKILFKGSNLFTIRK